MNEENFKSIPPTYRKEMVGNWLFRVATECGMIEGETDTEVIERTLKQQRERIAELEAEKNSFARQFHQALTNAYEANERIKELEALVSQSAGGAGVRMETRKLECYQNDFNVMARDWNRSGWQLSSVILLKSDEQGEILLSFWQRPVRSEVSE